MFRARCNFSDLGADGGTDPNEDELTNVDTPARLPVGGEGEVLRSKVATREEGDDVDDAGAATLLMIANQEEDCLIEGDDEATGDGGPAELAHG